jgi:hypothetical protein
MSTRTRGAWLMAVLLLAADPASAAAAGRVRRPAPDAFSNGPVPNALDIGGAYADFWNVEQAMRLCGDIGPACPQLPPPEVTEVSCRRGKDGVATCRFTLAHLASRPERCVGRLALAGVGWRFLAKNDFVPPGYRALDADCEDLPTAAPAKR